MWVVASLGGGGPLGHNLLESESSWRGDGVVSVYQVSRQCSYRLQLTIDSYVLLIFITQRLIGPFSRLGRQDRSVFRASLLSVPQQMGLGVKCAPKHGRFCGNRQLTLSFDQKKQQAHRLDLDSAAG